MNRWEENSLIFCLSMIENNSAVLKIEGLADKWAFHVLDFGYFMTTLPFTLSESAIRHQKNNHAGKIMKFPHTLVPPSRIGMNGPISRIFYVSVLVVPQLGT